jgi:hypothetical protein
MKNRIKYIGLILATAALIFTGAASVSASDEGFTIHYEGESLERHRAVSGGEASSY